MNRDPEEPVLAIDLEWAPRYVAELLVHLTAIREPGLRALALAEKLAALTNDDIIVVARRLYDEALSGAGEAFDLLACLQDPEALEARLGRNRMLAISNQARLAGHGLVAELLRPPERTPPIGTRTHRDLRELTLGHRKALARGPDKDILAKLLDDDHPHVQELLLSNPRLLVRDVIGVVSRRPALAHVLRGIARHKRWMHNHEVQRALALNPETPIDVSARILPNLTANDLEDLASNKQMLPTVRELARERLQRMPRTHAPEAEVELTDSDALPLSLDHALAELGVEYTLGRSEEDE